jgi:hypothetical protein
MISGIIWDGFHSSDELFFKIEQTIYWTLEGLRVLQKVLVLDYTATYTVRSYLLIEVKCPIKSFHVVALCTVLGQYGVDLPRQEREAVYALVEHHYLKKHPRRQYLSPVLGEADLPNSVT